MPVEGISALILAAGHGSRMKSDLLKVLHPVGGRTMIDRVVGAVEEAGIDQIAVVVGHQADMVRDDLGNRVRYIHQEEQLGTGHAVLMAEEMIEPSDHLLVLYGDCPLVTPGLLTDFLKGHLRGGAHGTILTAVVEDPQGYGRIIRGPDGSFEAIREQVDLTGEEESIREINTGMGCFLSGPLFSALHRVGRDNRAGEYYLVDAFPLMLLAGGQVDAHPAPCPDQVLGVNTRVDLARAETSLKMRVLEKLMLSGVTILDPSSTHISEGVAVGRDTVIHPFTVVEGASEIGSACILGPGAHVVDSRLGDRVRLWHSVVEESCLGDDVQVGPYAHLRPQSYLSRGVKVGNFAEIKNSRVGEGTKVPHHSYLGDAEVGKGVNIGAGSITVNYDGKHKHVTVIEEGAFIGCNSNLIAPVRVGRRAFVAAGTTVSEDVPPEALALGRAQQSNLKGWARRRLRPKGESGH